MCTDRSSVVGNMRTVKERITQLCRAARGSLDGNESPARAGVQIANGMWDLSNAKMRKIAASTLD
jgi:hypothetical protein